MASTAPLLSQLQAHLDQLESNPSSDIDNKLFESCNLVLPQTIQQNDSIAVITQLSRVLPTLQTDPTQVINFLILLLEPYSFSDILSLDTGIDFVAGLDVQAYIYNRLMLALINKATRTAIDAAAIASKPEVVTALVKLWLCTPDAGVAQESGKVLLALLKADQQSPPGSGEDPLPAHSQGLMWKRVFGDQDIYALIFSICSLKAKGEPELSKNQRTLAQARLLEWLPVVGAMNWNAITKNHHPSVESQYTDGKGEGLVYFAAACMVDVKDDVLMHRCLIEFYADLVQQVKQTEQASSAHSSVSLDFLVAHGLHDKTLSFYLDPTNPRHDPLDLHFVYAPSANYLAVYASTYPQHFMATPVKDRTLQRLRESLNLSPSRWAHAESPKHDLHILASLPRLALLPTTGSAWNTSPLSLLPSKSTNPDVLDTLATIFHGPAVQEVLTFPMKLHPSSSSLGATASQTEEAQAARLLYYLYLTYNPLFFQDLVKHADTVALEQHALASINILTAIATATWTSPSSTSASSSSELESTYRALIPSTAPAIATPATGALALLAPPSLQYTHPYLLSPPLTFSNIVGGVGDAQNPAYKIAVAKFEALKALHAGLSREVGDKVKEGGREGQSEDGVGYVAIVETLRKRISEGVWGARREGEVGNSIATMEL